jgi:tRNA pseudouridine55 synthase
MTSTQAVSVVRRLFGSNKAGHAGTLDPLASGCLPIALGEATKTVPFVQDGRKVYRFTVRWGVQTDTDDAEGQPIASSDHRPAAEAVAAALPHFTGDIMQVPPVYSALKIDGERAYDLARDGETVTLEARPVSIHRLDLIAADADTAVLEAECGKGTYVRSLARDLGLRLGTFGHVTALRRLVVGPFDETSLVPLADLQAAAETGPEACDAYLRPVADALFDLPEIALTGADAGRVMRGQPVLLRGRDAPYLGGMAYATSAGRLLAIGDIDQGALHPKRVFNL